MKMNPVIHFEMSADNQNRAAEFYAKVFGWQYKKTGAEMGNYVVVSTTESDEKGPKKPGAINGGLYDRSQVKPDQQYPSVVIHVEDYKEHMEKIEKEGGKILGEPMEIPGVGWYVSFRDTEGNRVGILQPIPMN
ncbi:MAG: glyoxalase/bleomycin resistance protein/dioxygenase [Candidatus Gottesmanbacteria bacterium GW2011_GWA2_43_14]|uniref:Glyoxalase/bleomycin resistance protein/dioxygenase n=1 Tax=Candidatus Gottesmanbacteria bacterium GW2011_GWA2_43_14 TaxID=1618443 RepID=A0A0G1DK32_9BACT|nr:MAG: glyoxalase/bleomycin resistance protein/dioxygenase [Candidatus Gottesmanbacteria bacterium GW2011_GWA2_43_14]